MKGLVLWSNKTERRAVLWCEDHGDLAYFDYSKQRDKRFEPGDMVEFEIRIRGQVRFAHSARVIKSKVFNDLQSKLQEAAAAQPAISPRAGVRQWDRSSNSADYRRFPANRQRRSG